VDFATGANHAGGAAANSDCIWCHAPTGPNGADVVHRGVQRAALASNYEFIIDDVRVVSDTLEVDYLVRLDDDPMDLAADPEWTAGGASRLYISVGWDTGDYTNTDSGSTPAMPLGINALDVGGAASALGGGLYQVVADLDGTGASGTVSVIMDGHPAADLDGDSTYSDRIAVRNAYSNVNVDGGRAVPVARRDAVDIGKCNACHDAAGQGISLHGNNRTGEMQVCVVCHNPNATDINRRPAPPAVGVDGKAEESIDMKRMIHQIHSGEELANGVVIYGYGNSVHDFGGVHFIGNRMNCETCHDSGTYGAADAAAALPSTIDTGADAADPDDDLNISPIAAACSSCHDDSGAADHMKLHGASFQALDADIL
jgi:OmcA/MtrC family decaheme c-type cytochrome